MFFRRISDSENDSGYGTTSDYFPLMKFLSSQSLNKDLKMTGDCEEETGDEEELHEIQDSIETILEGLLGGVLGDAFVDQLYPNSILYLNLFSEYQPKLVKVIEDLSRALQKALHNLPNENGITPTTAHAALKSVIAALVDECQDIPCLESTPEEEDSMSQQMQSLSFTHVMSSYESLIAAAVINKVVEESQSKFKSCAYTESKQEIENYASDFHLDNEKSFDNMLNSTPFDLPVKCVQIEEIEEITQEFTDSEDDKLSSISKYSSSQQNIDEVGETKHSDLDSFINLDHPSEAPIPFPEFGCDLIEENLDNGDSPCHFVSTTSWEENWLFRKKKRLPLYSNFKYQLLTYCDEPPTMFIPYPSESTDVEPNESVSSELSETNSLGTIDFSSDSESLEVTDEEKLKFEDNAMSKSYSQSFQSSPVSLLSREESVFQPLGSCYLNRENIENVTFEADIAEEVDVKRSKEHVYGMEYKGQNPMKIEEEESKHNLNMKLEEELHEKTPPRPGTIAEREHKKWLNAVPLKNNPYSAENISKRSTHKTGFRSFQDFEHTVPSDESPLHKVNCGPKSINSELYERDYYINKEIPPSDRLFKLQSSMRRVSPDNCLSDEALNSFEEKVYVRSGKVFTLENRIRRLEREIKDTSIDTPREANRENEEIFHKKVVLGSSKQEVEKLKRSRPCQKVHSLTARSLSREFRDLAKLNFPKPMNRTIPVSSLDAERETLCSPESAQGSTQGDNGHGYTSDESNTSSTSVNKIKVGRHISRSILERATYWERRAEQGLLSDASVGEEFPGVDVD
ncbi:uro-adherence factor A isoform X2 [Parasteatoda tepidariorum]|uniref:uro-adherence factor A isoform X2 n=1 Tax=Parasteatoda tepidariorum TaxID=114398 RepID=UPI001C727D4E|nr:uncharacterized protein LOC107449944 isoform X2 [Parasteatoda tepidariorum]